MGRRRSDTLSLATLPRTSHKEISGGRLRCWKVLRYTSGNNSIFRDISCWSEKKNKAADDKNNIFMHEIKLFAKWYVTNLFIKVANNHLFLQLWWIFGCKTRFLQIEARLYWLIYSGSQRYSAHNGLNTSYVSLECLIRAKFPTGIAQHREQRNIEKHAKRLRDGYERARGMREKRYRSQPFRRKSRYKEISRGGRRLLAVLREILAAITVFLAILAAGHFVSLATNSFSRILPSHSLPISSLFPIFSFPPPPFHGCLSSISSGF